MTRDAIMARVEPEPNTGCWLWLGCVNHAGYGISGRTAHRLAYEAFVGRVPAGMELDHRCRQRSCVNPKHLEPVTHAENMRRSKRGSATRCDRGHAFSFTTNGARGVRRYCPTCLRDAQRRRSARRAA